MQPTSALTHAPWTENEVAAINAWQVSGVVHPFTCEGDHVRHQTLVAEADGWHCPDPDCSFTQDWAMACMTDLDMLRRAQRTRTMVWGRSAYLQNTPLAQELKKTKEALRATEDELAEARGRIGTLTQQNRAMRIVLSRITQTQKAGLVPSVEATAGMCDAAFLLDDGSRPIEDNFLPGEDDVDNCE